jgi:hypothetical protein
MLKLFLPPRGQSVDTGRRAEIRKAIEPQVVEQRIEQLMTTDEIRLSAIFSDDDRAPAPHLGKPAAT